MSVSVRIAVFGSRGSGKTIYLACLLDTLTNAGKVRLLSREGLFGIAAHDDTVSWLKEIKDTLKRGSLPIGTNRTTELAVDFTESGSEEITFRFRDYRGGDFENARWRDNDSAGKEGVSILDMLSDCDAVVLLLDAPRLQKQPDAIDFERYLAALSEYRRLNRGRELPIQILYSKKDEAEGADFKALAREWPPFRQLIAACRDHAEMDDDAVSCLRVDRSGEVARPLPDGSLVFQPSGVIESFTWLAERILARKRRRRVRAAAAWMGAALAGLVACWGGLAVAHEREAAALMEHLASPALQEREAVIQLTAHEGRWTGLRGALLTPWPSFRKNIEKVRAERDRRGEGIRRQLRGALDQALAAEPRKSISKDVAFYLGNVAIADEYLELFGSKDAEAVAERDLFDEKVRVLRLRDQTAGVNAASAIGLIDTAIRQKRFSVFGDDVGALRQHAVETAAWEEAYARLIAGLPDPGSSIEVPRLQSAITAIEEWYRLHGAGRPGAAETAGALSLKRRYQLLGLLRAVDAARIQATGKERPVQVQVWRRLLEQYAEHPFDRRAAEASKWAAELSSVRTHVAEIERQIAESRRQEDELAAASRAADEARAALQITGPLTEDARERLKAALQRIGADRVSSSSRVKVQQHWEQLDYESALEAFRGFMDEPTKSSLATLRLALDTYERDRALHGAVSGRQPFLLAAGELVNWAESPRDLTIHVQQSGPLYVEFEVGGARADTARGGAASTVRLTGVDPLVPIRISYRYRDRGEPTRVATVSWRPIDSMPPSERSYRGSHVVMRVESGRPIVPVPGR